MAIYPLTQTVPTPYAAHFQIVSAHYQRSPNGLFARWPIVLRPIVFTPEALRHLIAETEQRHGLANQNEKRGDVVDEGVAAHRRQHAQRNGQQGGNDLRGKREFDGRPQRRENEVAGWHLGNPGDTKVTLKYYSRKPAAVLHDERLVEAEFAFEFRDVFICGRFRQQHACGVGGVEQQDERHHGDYERDTKRVQELV